MVVILFYLTYCLTVVEALYSLSTLGPFHVFFHLTGDGMVFNFFCAVGAICMFSYFS